MDGFDLQIIVEQFFVALRKNIADRRNFCKTPARILAVHADFETEGFCQKAELFFECAHQCGNRRTWCKYKGCTCLISCCNSEI